MNKYFSVSIGLSPKSRTQSVANLICKSISWDTDSINLVSFKVQSGDGNHILI